MRTRRTKVRFLAAVDRIEGERAVLIAQDERRGSGEGDAIEMVFPAGLLGPIREGDILAVTVEPSPDATTQARKRVRALLDENLRRGRTDQT